MLFWTAAISVLLIIILAVVLHYFSSQLSELHQHFLILAGICLLIVLIAGAFLTYAVPILASDKTSTIFRTSGDVTIIQDTPVGFPSSSSEEQ